VCRVRHGNEALYCRRSALSCAALGSLRSVRSSPVLCTSKSNHNGEALTAFSKSGGWPSLATRRRKERLILSAANTQGPRERSRHHRGLALASQALRGLRLGSLDTTSTKIVLGAAADHRERNHVAGIAMQIPRYVRKGTCVFHTRRFHVASGTYPYGD
jgi:hypothetical protein